MADESNIGLPKSKVGGELAVTSKTWVVSIIRLPESNQPEHVFLLVEGISESGTLIVRKYHLVADNDKDRKGYAKILTKSSDEQACDVQLIAEVSKKVKARFQSWHISPIQAAMLDSDVLNDQRIADSSPPPMKYSVFGNQSALASSSSHEGHNCFTWAREKLLNLKDTSITDSSIDMKITDWLAAKPSLYLPDPTDSSMFNLKNVAIGVAVTVAAIVARGFFKGAGDLPPIPTPMPPSVPTPLPTLPRLPGKFGF